jgi:hypothetical protein
MPLTKIQSLGITDGTIVNADINASAAIAGTKLTGVGKVLQVVQTFKANAFSSTSTSFVDVTDLSVSITPSSASNKILVFCTIPLSANADAIIQLLRGSTVIGSGTGGTQPNGNGFAQISSTLTGTAVPLCINFLDSPSTTSSTTYKIQARLHDTGTFTINLRQINDAFSGSSTLTAFEIAG